MPHSLLLTAGSHDQVHTHAQWLQTSDCTLKVGLPLTLDPKA